MIILSFLCANTNYSYLWFLTQQPVKQVENIELQASVCIPVSSTYMFTYSKPPSSLYETHRGPTVSVETCSAKVSCPSCTFHLRTLFVEDCHMTSFHKGC